MSKLMKQLVALMLMVSILAGMLPVEGIAMMQARAQVLTGVEEQAREAETVVAETAIAFADVAALAQQRLEEYGPQDDGEWQYVLLPELGYAVVTGHHDRGTSAVEVPAVLGGADVVALLSGVFAQGHEALFSVTMAHNVYYAAPDALPRGVSVRGYHGSYAQSWALENAFAFENLSELDFAAGVVDLSDVAAEHFVRHDAASVTLRALEAHRLQVGSVFFLADPDNLYAVSFYQVESFTTADDGYVTLACRTPEISRVLNSIELHDTPMIPDWNTMEMAADMQPYSDTLTLTERAEGSHSFGFNFSPSISIGKKGKFTGQVGYNITSTASAEYGNFELKSFEIENREGMSLSGTFSVSSSLYEEEEPNTGYGTVEDRLNAVMLAMRKYSQGFDKAKLETKQKLCSVTLFSLYGVLNFTLDINLNVSFSGSVTLTYSSSTVTNYKYVDGEMVSKSRKDDEAITLNAEAEIKAGLTVGIKLYLVVIECAKLELFIGIRATASYEASLIATTDENGELTSSAVIQGVATGTASLAILNMMDCINIDVDFIIELTAQVGNDLITFYSGTATLLEVPIASLHCHLSPVKFGREGLQIVTWPKTSEDFFHDADSCPLMDAIGLWVPEVSTTEAASTYTLFGRTSLNQITLDLPDHALRVDDWYKDEDMSKPVEWPLAVKSGDKLWGDAEEVSVFTVVGFDGQPMSLYNGEAAVFLLSEGEEHTISRIDFENGDHIVGWVMIESPDDPEFLEDVSSSKNYTFTGDQERHTLLAICDNDLEVVFKASNGEEIKSFTWGHFIEIPESMLPEFESEYDPDYAVATYEWRTMWGDVVEFPHTATGQRSDRLVLYCNPTGIKRVYEADDSATVLGAPVTLPGGLTTYSSADFFRYRNEGDHVVITGFNKNQSYVDENGEMQSWTAVPEVLQIPAYIDDVPVTQIDADAFRDLKTLVAVTVPRTVTHIGGYAFAGCTGLLKIDLSACEGLKELPYNFACDASALSSILLPSSVELIGNYAFRNCTSLTNVVINSDLGVQAFAGCTSLKSVQLKYRVTSIGAEAFQNCTSLTSLTVPCSVTEAGRHFIAGCTGLTSLTLDGGPARVTEDNMYIGQGSKLTTLTMMLGVTHVEEHAFSNGSHGNPNLTSITLPDALIEMGDNALSGTAVEYLHVHDLSMLGYGFARQCKTLRELSFDKGVISNYAFQYCSNLEKVTMGDEVFAIGRYAFQNCTALTEITVGKNMEIIGQGAFQGCTGLKQVQLGDTLLELGSSAFEGCTALMELVIPPTVETMGNNIIKGCTALTKLTIGGAAMPTFDGWNWLGYIKDSALETVIIGEGVTTIGAKALANCRGQGSMSYVNAGHQKLTSVVLPSTLEEIGDQAFASAKTLQTVNFPAGLVHIGHHAFEQCNMLQPVCAAGLSLEFIGDHAFAYCHGMTSINLGKKLKTIGEKAFLECTSLESLVIPPSVESFGNSFIHKCAGLKHLTIGGPNQAAFDGWNLLGYMEDSMLETIVIGEGVTSLGPKAFANCVGQGGMSYVNAGFQHLKQVVLPSTLEKIDVQAFANAQMLEVVNLPASLTYIGDNAFDSCRALQLNCAEGLSLEHVGNQAFARCDSLTSIELGSALETLGNRAFLDCVSLVSLTVPPSVVNMGSEIVAGCSSLKELTIGGPNQSYFDGWKCLGYIEDSVLEKVVIGEGVAILGRKALANCVGQDGMSYVNAGHRSLKQVVLPASLEEIEIQAFGNASALGMLELPEGLISIGEWAFSACESLQLDCPDRMNLLTIGNFAFSGCKSLTEINLGKRLKSIGTGAFEDCTSLLSLVVPPSVEEIGNDIIVGCTGLKSLTIGGPNQAYFDGWNWLGCIRESALETVIIREGVTTLGPKALANCVGKNGMSWVNAGFDKLRNISLPSTLTTIEEQAIASVGAVEEIVLPDGVTYIGKDALSWCKALTTLHTNAYSAVVEAYSAGAKLTYVADAFQAVLTLAAGDVTIGTEAVDFNAPLAEVLAAYVPADQNGLTFAGWYTDVACTCPWQGSTMPAFAMTLYAKMTPLRTASFVTVCGGKYNTVHTVAVGEGLLIPWPEEPAQHGYCFEGWYTDADMTRKLQTSAVMGSSDITLYGKMTSRNAGTVYTPVAGGVMLTKYLLQPGESTEVWLPSTVDGRKVVAIGEHAFDEAEEITVLHLPDSLVTIQPGALDALSNLTWITTSDQCEGFTAVNGMLYSSDMGTLVCVPQGRRIHSLRLYEEVHTIAMHAVMNQQLLSYVDLGDHVKTLEAEAFAGCGMLETFIAHGLEYIGADAIPTSNSMMRVYGPVKEGVLRDYFLVPDSKPELFQCPYNLYYIRLYVEGALLAGFGLEAGSTLSADHLYGEMDNGMVINTWYTDDELTIAWEEENGTPTCNLELYAPFTPVYEYEEFEYETESGEVDSAARLTAYHGEGGALVLPQTMDGLPVTAIGPAFLAQCSGRVDSVRIGSAVTEIADTALAAPESCPFGGVVYADTDSYAARWAMAMGYMVKGGAYTLTFETFGGAVIASKQVAAGTYVRVPAPVRTGCTFLGWYLDEELTTPADLENGCYVTPACDMTLYAAWEGDPAQWPFTYKETGEGVVITGYTSLDGELIIPESINGVPVVAIDDYAFAGAGVTSLTLPASLKRIGVGAFTGSSLERVDLGGARMLGEKALAGCKMLKNVTMTMVETIGGSAFAGCEALRSIHLPATVTTVAPTAFDGCSRLGAFTADDGGVFTAQDGVLIRNDTLWRYPPLKLEETYTLPAGVTRIGENAFRGAAYLTEIHLHDDLEGIGPYAFADCRELTAFTLTENMWIGSIPEGAFSGCAALRDVEMSAAVSAVSADAFAHCGSLAQVTIPDTVTKIDAAAFRGVRVDMLTILGSYQSPAWLFAMENGYFFIDPSLVQVTDISITSMAQCYLGEISQLKVEITPADAPLCGEIRWESSDEGILYVADGQAHALSMGEVVITATAPNGVSTSLVVEVTTKPAELSAHTLVLLPGQAVTICLDGALPDCTWTTSDAAVAKVAEGHIVAVGVGSAAVTCTSAEGHTLEAAVQVVDSLNAMTFPAALNSVEDEAFMGMSHVERVILGENVSSVGQLAFAQCSALVQLEMPAGEIIMAENALEGCDRVVMLVSRGSAAHTYALENGLPYVLIGE